MKGYYQLKARIEEVVKATSTEINHLSFGNFDEVDINRQSIFPLVHVIIPTATDEGSFFRFRCTFLYMDIVDINTETEDNKADVLHNMLTIGTQHLKQLKDESNGVTLDGDFIPADQFSERFSNLLTGWAFDVEILVKHEIGKC